MSALVRLYPRAWRDRYEDEFLALLEVRPPTLTDRFDIIRGAVDARIHPQVRRTAQVPPPVPEADVRIARRLGIAALLGAILWPAAFGIMLLGPVVYDGYGAYRDGSAAFPVFLLAVALLVGGLCGQIVRLPTSAHVARGAAGAAIPFLVLLAFGPWLWISGLIGFGFLAVLAVAGAKNGLWPVPASLAVILTYVLVVIITVVAVQFGDLDRMTGGVIFLISGLLLISAWLSVGWTLVRGLDGSVGPTAA